MLTLEQFEQYAYGASAVAQAHRNAIPDFPPVAAAAASVHSDAAAVASSPGFINSGSDEALMLLSCHSLNLFLEFVGSIMRGRFDAASYLARPAHDAAAVLRLTAGHEGSAQRFLSGDEVLASDARKATVSELRGLPPAMFPPELVDDVEPGYLDAADAANTLAHVSLHHVDKLVEPAPGAGLLRATIGGRVDASAATRMLCVACYCEALTLYAIATRKGQRLGAEWGAACQLACDGLATWVAKHRTT